MTLELGVLGVLLILAIGGACGAYAIGKTQGREKTLRELAELQGKEREALLERIRKTPKPKDHGSALDRA